MLSGLSFAAAEQRAEVGWEGAGVRGGSGRGWAGLGPENGMRQQSSQK